MSTRQRPGDKGADDARRHAQTSGREIRNARRIAAMSIQQASIRAGISKAQLGRIELGRIRRPTLEQLCRAARAVGLEASLRYYPSDEPVGDRGQLAVADRFAAILGTPLRLRHEVGLPMPGDKRAWDARCYGGGRWASIEYVARLEDIQALARRIELKSRDDPDAGPVILVLARTAHNRRILELHREVLRAQFPLDGAAILRDLRAGRAPTASGIVLI